MSEKKEIKIGDLFTDDELRAALKVIEEFRAMSVLASEIGAVPVLNLNDRLQAQVVTPAVMERINRETGQKNDPDYLCYVLQYAHTMSG